MYGSVPTHSERYDFVALKLSSRRKLSCCAPPLTLAAEEQWLTGFRDSDIGKTQHIYLPVNQPFVVKARNEGYGAVRFPRTKGVFWPS